MWLSEGKSRLSNYNIKVASLFKLYTNLFLEVYLTQWGIYSTLSPQHTRMTSVLECLCYNHPLGTLGEITQNGSLIQYGTSAMSEKEGKNG